jgi:uncharacterized protein (DUF1778 family)
MYANPAHIKHKRVNLSLNEEQFAVFFEKAQAEGKQVTPLILELALKGLDLLEGHGIHVPAHRNELPRAQA